MILFMSGVLEVFQPPSQNSVNLDSIVGNTYISILPGAKNVRSSLVHWRTSELPTTMTWGRSLIVVHPAKYGFFSIKISVW